MVTFCRSGKGMRPDRFMHKLKTILQTNPRGAAYACSGNSFRGGVSPRFTRRLRGQSTAEYVLIIAIIGLVVLFAGPWIASAIRNQFNAVTETLNDGTSGNAFKDPVDVPDPQNGTAFAVYSEDDNSLMFYKRRGVPKAGDMFNDRRVTEVYTGFETQRFVDTSGNHSDWTSQKPDTPWWGRRLEISSAQVVDTGISPSNVDFWFYGMENLKTVDVANLDTSSCDDFNMTFGHCGQIETIDLSSWSTASLGNLSGTFLCCLRLSSLDIDGWDTSKVASFHCLMLDCGEMSSPQMQKVVDNLSVTACARDLGYLFYGCRKLTTLDLTGWNVSNVTRCQYMFDACRNLTLDCSNWNVRQDSWHPDFNKNAPGVILPKAWQ